MPRESIKPNFIRLHETDSTNRFLREKAPELPSFTIVTAEHQTAGRGQGSNSWESEAGKNLLFSILVRPTNVQADSQFVLSMAEALAVREAVCSLIGCEDEVSLKWPNDLYWNDMKLSGTLIETALEGKKVRHCIFGTGVNVNQTVFLSDAPNPVSMQNIVGHSLDRDELLQQIAESFAHYFCMVEQGESDIIRKRYHDVLYRRQGYHAFEDGQGRFEAQIIAVGDDGRLLLEDRMAHRRAYYFKEVSHVIK